MFGLNKAKKRDNTLKIFSGNSTRTWEYIRKNYAETYHTTENHIKFLLGEGCLNERDEHISLTNKGFSKLANLSDEGYYAANKSRVYSMLRIYFLAFCTILILSLSIYRTFFSGHYQKEAIQSTNTTKSESQEKLKTNTLPNQMMSVPSRDTVKNIEKSPIRKDSLSS